MNKFSDVADRLAIRIREMRSHGAVPQDPEYERLLTLVERLIEEHKRALSSKDTEVSNLFAQLSRKGETVDVRSMSHLLSKSAGRSILERAYRADPRRTETELFLLGDHRAASELGTWWLTEQARAAE